MTSQSFSSAFMVDQSSEEAFAAVNNVRDWWSGPIEGATDELDAEFTYRYQDVHYSKQRTIEFVPGKKVVWRVLPISTSRKIRTNGRVPRSRSRCRGKVSKRKGDSPMWGWCRPSSATTSAQALGASTSTTAFGA